MHRIIIMFTLASACFAAHARADAPLECIARKEGIDYTVQLTGASDNRSLTVTDSRGTVTSGRAAVYRRGTRFFLPGERGDGFKLGIDGDSWSLCFDDGGRDCYSCQPIASPRERYFAKQVCAIETPMGPYTATLYSNGTPVQELVLADSAGEYASGPAHTGVHAEQFVSLWIGPSERYWYLVDAQFLCPTTDEDDCYPCSQSSYETNRDALRLPRTVLATCSTPTNEITLTEQGGHYFMSRRGLEPQLGGDFGDGPATYHGGDRWSFYGGFYELTLSSGVGELCSSGGCEPCVYAWDD